MARLYRVFSLLKWGILITGQVYVCGQEDLSASGYPPPSLAPGFDDRKEVHIANIDPFAIVESPELSSGSKSKFLAESGTNSWHGRIRTKALESLDRILFWTFDKSLFSYSLKVPLEGGMIFNRSQEILDFSRDFGYFSPERPLIAKVSSDDADIRITFNLLTAIHNRIINPKQRSLAIGEVLTKILAYRDLHQGLEIPIPTQEALVTYEVDTIFDLGDGMPAFGLLPKEQTTAAPPILLFRGTDVSLSSQRGLASIMSDFDPAGAGFSTFLKAKTLLHQWLEKAAKKGPKARVMGFSLGGALAAYTFLYERALVNDDRLDPSLSFNAPGVSKKVLRKWDKLESEKKEAFKALITRGDLVSKVGRLVGEVEELSINKNLYPIEAHVLLISGQPFYYHYFVEVSKENQSHRLLK